MLIHHILRKLIVIKDSRHVGVSASALEILLNYNYPGNVRELENILEHALIICQDDTIYPSHLPDYIQDQQFRDVKGRDPLGKSETTLDGLERDRLLQALKKHGWHRRKTAKELGIDRTTLWRKMKKLQISH